MSHLVSKMVKNGTAGKKGQSCRHIDQINVYTYIKKGERTQSPFCFRLDNDNRERLSAVPNKGRFINEAIREKLHTLGID